MAMGRSYSFGRIVSLETTRRLIKKEIEYQKQCEEMKELWIAFKGLLIITPMIWVEPFIWIGREGLKECLRLSGF
jgi:hypothetical protein